MNLSEEAHTIKNRPWRNRKIEVITRIFHFTIALALLSGSATQASHIKESGYYLKAGLGFSPLTEIETNSLEEIADISARGVAPSILIGYSWNQENSIEFRWQNVYYTSSEPESGSQGIIALAYTRTFLKDTFSPFLTFGLGIQHGPFISEFPRDVETDPGAAFLLGAGFTLNQRIDLALDYSSGSANKFLDKQLFYDYNYRQLVFSVRYLLFGD
ncbi:MAG: porin family protein [candidate division Zixibacteria bacterium]|nr:porin family protein [candidate division Zixibacteria bacterium]